MAMFWREEATVKRVKFRVAAADPYGACWVEVYKAVSAATQELRELGKAPAEGDPADDAIHISPGDEDIVVWFEVEG